MKKTFLYATLFLFGLSSTFVSCSDDDDSTKSAANLDYSASNAKSWGNYMQNVASLLKTDASNLYKAWNEGGVSSYKEAFATTFKNHTGGEYSSAKNCVQEIIEKCAEIANEVGQAKIGDPLALYESGKTTEALYAVESWYSWHSIDDYSNNILSIRNSYYGVKSYDNAGATTVTPAANSLYTLVNSKNAELNEQMVAAIDSAWKAIQNIPNPFRNHINSDEAKNAQTACADLENLLTNTLLPYIFDNSKVSESELQPIVEQYVDAVVLPTYKELSERNAALYEKVDAFVKNPSNSAMTACASAWLTARKPWETSEAFLFGPVDLLGLDPNMDSWPLDQEAIVNILNSGNYDDLNWSDGDEGDAIEAAQNVRGFHTLEYLIFKDGKARTVE